MIQFLGGLLSGMILLLIAQRIAIAYSSRDRKTQLIEDTAKAYLALDKNMTPLGIQGLVTAGAARLKTTGDLLAVRQIIIVHGCDDPLGWALEELKESECLDFIKWQARNGCTFRDYQSPEFFCQFVEKFRKTSGG